MAIAPAVAVIVVTGEEGVYRLLILSQGEEVTGTDVGLFVSPGGSAANPVLNLLDQFEQFSEFRDMAEKLFIESILLETGGNKLEAAKRLEMDKTTLFRKIKRLRINA